MIYYIDLNSFAHSARPGRKVEMSVWCREGPHYPCFGSGSKNSMVYKRLSFERNPFSYLVIRWAFDMVLGVQNPMYPASKFTPLDASETFSIIIQHHHRHTQLLPHIHIIKQHHHTHYIVTTTNTNPHATYYNSSHNIIIHTHSYYHTYTSS